MNILVTGGAGFIGSHLCESLLMLGHKVVCLDNFNGYYNPEIKRRNISALSSSSKFVLYEGDILNKVVLSSVFSNYPIEIVIHLAAMVGVRPSIDESLLYFNVNVIGTLNILEVMKDFTVKKLIFASSSSVYGNNNSIPFSERDISDSPISQYAASKKAGELLCHTYHHLYNFDIHCLRLFTVFGPRQRPDLAIHKFTDSIINASPITIFGDWNSSRDYTYIDDIIDGFLKSTERVNGFEIFNLGESKTITLKKLITLLEKNLNKKAIIKELPNQLGDVQITCANIEKAIRVLEYNPVWEFEKGLIEFIKWKLGIFRNIKTSA